MRRFTFYFFIALLTFGISSLIALKFYWKVESDSLNVKKEVSTQPISNAKLLESPWKYLPPPTPETEIPAQPFCKDAKILPLWNELVKDRDFRSRWQYSVENLDCREILELKEIDLNRDGQKEILLRGINMVLCGGVGNCAFWIYQKKGKQYKKLLFSTDYTDVTELPDQVKKARTNGYLDILLKGHDTAADTNYRFYKFDGRKYRQTKCLEETPIPDTGDNPKWEFIGCREYDKRQGY